MSVLWSGSAKNPSRLTILHKDPEKGRSKFTVVRCECGAVKSVSTSDLNRGKLKSCGCMSAERKRIGTDRTFYNKKSRVGNAQIKTECLTHYGPDGILQCTAVGCEVTDLDMLTLDHVNNDGAKDRREGRNSTGVALYYKLKREGYPLGFATLCCNHQGKKELLRRRLLAQEGDSE